MATSTTFEIGDYEYEVRVASFSPPERATRDCPGDGGEVEPAPFVTVLKDGKAWDVVTFDTFLLYYAAENGASLRLADRKVYDELFQIAYENWLDARDEYTGRRRGHWED